MKSYIAIDVFGESLIFMRLPEAGNDQFTEELVVNRIVSPPGNIGVNNKKSSPVDRESVMCLPIPKVSSHDL